MALIKKIIELANRGICIDYQIISQKENGNGGDRGIPNTTYTISVCPSSSFHDPLDSQSFDDLEKGLEWGVKRGKEALKESKRP